MYIQEYIIGHLVDPRKKKILLPLAKLAIYKKKKAKHF